MGLDSTRDQLAKRRASIQRSDQMTDAEKAFIAEYADAYDPDVLSTTPPSGDSTLAHGTIKQKCTVFKRFAESTDLTESQRDSDSAQQSPDSVDLDVSEADADDVNAHLTEMKRGTHPDFPDGGYAKNTVVTAALGLRVVYDYHDQIAKSDIAVPEGSDTNVDEADMFEASEIQALRDACSNPRDRALLELLINTGQRLRAVQTLRLKDIFIEQAMFRLNPTADGLKGASGKRPLLGAVGPVRRWMRQHPTGNPEDYLITPLASSSGTAGEPLATDAIRDRLTVLGNRADIEKPTNPHNFRHYFVTVCKRDYGLSDSQIKHLIGHRPDSNVMSTTYSHLTDDEIATNVAVEAGFKEDEDERSALSPPACTTCDEPLPDDAKACPICGTTFTPDAKAVEDQIEDMLYHTRAEADEDEAAELDRTRERIRNDPEFKAALVEELLED